MFCWLFQKRFYNKKDKTDVYKKPALISEVIIWFFSVNQALVAYQVNFTVFDNYLLQHVMTKYELYMYLERPVKDWNHYFKVSSSDEKHNLV